MELNQTQRTQIASVMGQYLDQYVTKAKEPSWATLWSQPSKLEPDVVKLIAVLDQPKAVKVFSKNREDIQAKMKTTLAAQNLRLYVDVVPTSEFHRMYQSQYGFDFIQEWNGDLQTTRKSSILGSWLRSNKVIRVLMPVLIACTLVWIIRAYLAQAL